MNVVTHEFQFSGSLNQNMFPDILLTTRDAGRGDLIPAHRAVLAAVSEKLHDLCYPGGIVEVRNISHKVLRGVVEFIYRGYFVGENPEEIADLIDGLDMLKVNVVPKMGGLLKEEDDGSMIGSFQEDEDGSVEEEEGDGLDMLKVNVVPEMGGEEDDGSLFGSFQDEEDDSVEEEEGDGVDMLNVNVGAQEGTLVFCKECGKGLSHQKRVRYHMLSHYYGMFAEVLPVEYGSDCPDCFQSFRDRSSLLRHYAFVHKHIFEVTGKPIEYFSSAA